MFNIFSVSFSQQPVIAKPDGCEVGLCAFPAWEWSRGFVRADTLLLCVLLSRLHTEVWEAVCRCGSQQQRKRRACDWGTFGLVHGGVGGSEAGKWETWAPTQTAQTDGEEISRECIPTWAWLYVSFAFFLGCSLYLKAQHKDKKTLHQSLQKQKTDISQRFYSKMFFWQTTIVVL